MSWRYLANQAIQRGYHEITAAEPDISVEDLCKRISLNYYPFGLREMYPYQVWLRAIKCLKKKLLHNTELKRKHSDQQELF